MRRGTSGKETSYSSSSSTVKKNNTYDNKTSSNSTRRSNFVESDYGPEIKQSYSGGWHTPATEEHDSSTLNTASSSSTMSTTTTSTINRRDRSNSNSSSNSSGTVKSIGPSSSSSSGSSGHQNKSNSANNNMHNGLDFDLWSDLESAIADKSGVVGRQSSRSGGLPPRNINTSNRMIESSSANTSTKSSPLISYTSSPSQSPRLLGLNINNPGGSGGGSGNHLLQGGGGGGDMMSSSSLNASPGRNDKFSTFHDVGLFGHSVPIHRHESSGTVGGGASGTISSVFDNSLSTAPPGLLHSSHSPSSSSNGIGRLPPGLILNNNNNSGMDEDEGAGFIPSGVFDDDVLIPGGDLDSIGVMLGPSNVSTSQARKSRRNFVLDNDIGNENDSNNESGVGRGW
jgi:hypothetical protein